MREKGIHLRTTQAVSWQFLPWVPFHDCRLVPHVPIEMGGPHIQGLHECSLVQPPTPFLAKKSCSFQCSIWLTSPRLHTGHPRTISHDCSQASQTCHHPLESSLFSPSYSKQTIEILNKRAVFTTKEKLKWYRDLPCLLFLPALIDFSPRHCRPLLKKQVSCSRAVNRVDHHLLQQQPPPGGHAQACNIRSQSDKWLCQDSSAMSGKQGNLKVIHQTHIPASRR